MPGVAAKKLDDMSACAVSLSFAVAWCNAKEDDHCITCLVFMVLQVCCYRLGFVFLAWLPVLPHLGIGAMRLLHNFVLARRRGSFRG